MSSESPKGQQEGRLVSIPWYLKFLRTKAVVQLFSILHLKCCIFYILLFAWYHVVHFRLYGCFANLTHNCVQIFPIIKKWIMKTPCILGLRLRKLFTELMGTVRHCWKISWNCKYFFIKQHVVVWMKLFVVVTQTVVWYLQLPAIRKLFCLLKKVLCISILWSYQSKQICSMELHGTYILIVIHWCIAFNSGIGY